MQRTPVKPRCTLWSLVLQTDWLNRFGIATCYQLAVCMARFSDKLSSAAKLRLDPWPTLNCLPSACNACFVCLAENDHHCTVLYTMLGCVLF